MEQFSLPLSRREREILQLVAAGKTDWEIGKILSISEKTVNAHVENMKRKYSARSRVQVVAKVLAGKLPELPNAAVKRPREGTPLSCLPTRMLADAVTAAHANAIAQAFEALVSDVQERDHSHRVVALQRTIDQHPRVFQAYAHAMRLRRLHPGQGQTGVHGAGALLPVA